MAFLLVLLLHCGGRKHPLCCCCCPPRALESFPSLPTSLPSHLPSFSSFPSLMPPALFFLSGQSLLEGNGRSRDLKPGALWKDSRGHWGPARWQVLNPSSPGATRFPLRQQQYGIEIPSLEAENPGASPTLQPEPSTIASLRISTGEPMRLKAFTDVCGPEWKTCHLDESCFPISTTGGSSHTPPGACARARGLEHPPAQVATVRGGVHSCFLSG